jgi:hypothetical protein
MLQKNVFLFGVVLFVLLSFYPIIFVGAASGMWDQTYGGVGIDGASAVVETSDGGFAIAGGTNSYGAGESDFWLIKTDGSGNTQWNRTYGGQGFDGALAMVETSDGGFAIAGETNSFGAGGYDFWLIKTDSSGNLVWNQKYGSIENDYASSLVETSDGGFAIAGGTNSYGAGKSDFWLIKTDGSGNTQWNRTYGSVENEYAYALAETSDGGFALAGFADTLGPSSVDFWLVKTDGTGNQQWNRTYGGSGYDGALALVVTSDGGFAIAGETNSGGAGQDDFLLVKTDGSGNTEWTQTYGGSGVDYTSGLVQTPDGGFALAGFTDSFGAGSFDFWLVKTDGAGNTQWNRTYGGTEWDIAASFIETSDGGFAIAGETNSFGAGNYDFWLVKTDEYGIIPEFSSLIILPLCMITILVIITYRNYLRRKDN